MKKVKFLMIALMLSVSAMVSAQTKAEVAEILEEFCAANYNECFDPRQYVEGTLVVKTLMLDRANNKIKVTGTHTCRGQSIMGHRETYSGREFKAELKLSQYGYDIKFWRLYKADFPWQTDRYEGPCQGTIMKE